MRTRRPRLVRFEAPLTAAEVAAARAIQPDATPAFLADASSVRRLLAVAR
jgi:hypothetical protein